MKDREGRPNCPLFDGPKLKLGLFGTNCSYGLCVSTAPTTYRATWEHTLAIARRADQIGFEILVPIARWRGFGGTTDFNGTAFETYTWATGLLALTKRILVCATSHVPMVHPIVAAKQCVTADHISDGRFALNVVMGWFTPEAEMFGFQQMAHDVRYRYGLEWLNIVKRLWTEDAPFDFEGQFFRIRNGQAWPKPLQKPYPVLVNAGNSPDGLDFSARAVDFNFMTTSTLETARTIVQDLKQRAKTYGREVGAMTYGLMVCRDTEREAREDYQRIINMGDLEAVNNLLKVLGIECGSHDETIRNAAQRFIAGWGGYPLIGTPEQIVDECLKISATGVEGIILGFLDYYEELQYFDRRVMPLLRQARLR